MIFPEDYLSAEKRAQVEAMKERIRSGEFDTLAMGHMTPESTDLAELIHQAIYQDEQGPWSVEEPHTELDIARYELALEAFAEQIRAEVRADVLAELSAEQPLEI